MAFRSVPVAIVPFDTTTLSLGVTFHLAFIETGSTLWPSGLMDISVVLVNTVVGVFLVFRSL